MPNEVGWRGNKCPGKEEYHTFESQFCLRECNHQCVPASVLVHIANKAFTEKHIGQYISATALLGCLRELYLERTTPWYQEPPTSWYSVRGTLLHAILENPDFAGLVNDMRSYVNRMVDKGMASTDLGTLWLTLESDLMAMASMMPKQYKMEDWESEKEFEMPLGVIDGKERFIRGTLDVIRRLAGEVLDYKTVGDKALPYIGKFGAKAEHEMQFNIYRLLAERGYPVGEKDTYVPFKVKRIRAFYLSMMSIVATGSTMTETTQWTGTPPKTFASEIARMVVAERDDIVMKPGKRKGSDNPEDYKLSPKKRYQITYEIPEVKLMDLDEVYKFVVDKATILFRAFDRGIMPPLPSKEMMLWRCDYCPVRGACDGICKDRGEVRPTQGDDDSEQNEIPVEEAVTKVAASDILPVEE
jgi:PD-(D/E)XK nuclease superfamily